MTSAKQMARLGAFQIQEAILCILAEEPEGLTPELISKAIGIREYTDEKFNQSYAIVNAVLIKLKEEEYVERCMGSRWRLTDPTPT